ncbi:hypothetical protein J2Z30_000342 [Streptomyces iranensis]|uniref:Uncharacterized protein n=1 Tax=Streptomyces iranensis TaxID=576784 RepID=A0ABS4MI30_9ACTN|nr:hypothetical protein [Streptomyces iranensis]
MSGVGGHALSASRTDHGRRKEFAGQGQVGSGPATP